MLKIVSCKNFKFYFVIILFTACQGPELKRFEAISEAIVYAGRREQNANNEIVLIGSASYARFQFSGDTCVLLLKNYQPYKLHNYISLELDSQYIGRFRLDGDSLISFSVPIKSKRGNHLLTVYKSTESANGFIGVAGVVCEELLPLKESPQKSIEFIGNSITCGMGLDLDIPCDTDQWYDQHNAYWAYGPLVSRRLDVNFMLSSVSGIGIYRNWNSDGPTMPTVYENTYLITDSVQKWNFSQFNPDVVSIALGTNDFSDGDGTKVRLPFDTSLYISNYIAFIENVYAHYPLTQIALLTSPMISGNKGQIYLQCLKSVKRNFKNSGRKEIQIFEFDNITPHGCGYHPDKADHQLMANQLYLFYKALLEN